MESLSAGLRGLGSMVTRAAAPADALPTAFELGPAGLIVGHWSHTSLSLFLINPDGSVAASVDAAGLGVAALSLSTRPPLNDPQKYEDIFEQQALALEQQAGGGVRPAIICGAVGGRGGWQGVDCVVLPAGVKHLAAAAQRVEAPRSGRAIFIVPGCAIRPWGKDSLLARLDVIRGEETTVMGSLVNAVLNQQPGAVFRSQRLFVLFTAAGSVWVATKTGEIVWFRSYRTGSVCDALAPLAGAACAAASVGSSATVGNPGAAMEQGLTEGLAAQESVLHQLVYLSTAPLVGELSGGQDGPSYAAGLIVGQEVNEAISLYRSAYPDSTENSAAEDGAEASAEADSAKRERAAALGSAPGNGVHVVLLCSGERTEGLLHLYRRALERHGCEVEVGDGAAAGAGVTKAEGTVASGGAWCGGGE